VFQATLHATGLDLDDLRIAGRSRCAKLFKPKDCEFAAANHLAIILPTNKRDNSWHIPSPVSALSASFDGIAPKRRHGQFAGN
jgi:hypothetical protein